MKLLVIVPDCLSLIIEKGEITSRYYNPGELFDEVHLLVTNDDKPNMERLQKTVGSAKLTLHNLPLPSFFTTLGWNRLLIRGWTKRGVALAGEIKPDAIRTHNNFIEGYLASKIKEDLSIPYIVSLHGVWDRDCLTTFKERVLSFFRKKFEYIALRASDAVIAVYSPILRYARRRGGKNIHLIYNILAADHLLPKTSYAIKKRPHLLTVNRQQKEKNPENIIRAVAQLDCEYTLIGTGKYHESLKDLVKLLGCEDRIHFIKAMPNEELCESLRSYDLMVSHCDYWGISKTIIEAALVGLPVILNYHPTDPIPDYEGGWVKLCQNTVEDYKAAIEELLESEPKRQALGHFAANYAKKHFEPKRLEENTVLLYREALQRYLKPRMV